MKFVIPLIVLSVYVYAVPVEKHAQPGNLPPSPPEILVHQQYDMYFKPGETVILPCEAEGNPAPIYVWTKNGLDYTPFGVDNRVEQLIGTGTLAIHRPEDKDEGIYQCRARNIYGVSVSINVNLWKAKLGPSPYWPKEIKRVHAGHALVLHCPPTVSYPPAETSWIIRETNGAWMYVNYDKRISIDLEGNLRFANVKSLDHQKGKAYACLVSNYILREYYIVREFVINVYGTSEQKIPAYKYWTSFSDEYALRGESLHIKCIFAGNPTPDVYWKKIGGILTNRTRFLSSGQELEIVNFRESDAGTYECMGMNTETTYRRPTKVFEIRIESAPYWINKPENLNKEEGETATVICVADGIPKPTIKWYINSIPLEEVMDPNSRTRDDRLVGNPRFSNPNETTIILANLTLDDRMNIQCNATNKHTYIFADFFLNILAEG